MLFHACQPVRYTEVLGVRLLPPLTSEERRAQLWAGHAASQPGVRLLLNPSAEEARSETASHVDSDACPHGHRWTEENTAFQANGARYCRACHRERERQRSRAQRRGGAEEEEAQ